ncbi:MAG: DEAD/DEAH box helicase [Methanobrevibacter sp.]|jgi:SNF2 family DNA or RNA helicase|nr:DEAD/DEAH box helicase [Methanobrevibacter sp.]
MTPLKISDKVISNTYPEYKVGTVIEIDTIGNENYCKVFFNQIKDFKTLPESSLKRTDSSIDKVNLKKYDNPLLFSIRLLCEKVQSISYQDKIISANNFNIIPLPHQILTISRVLEEFEPRMLIADEVGLGKTIEAALVYEELKLRKIVDRTLIISPSGLTSQWRDELKTKFNEDFKVINGEVFKGISSLHEGNVWTNYNQVITSIDFIKPKNINKQLNQKTKERREKHNEEVTENIVEAGWDMVIIDEAHNLTKDVDTHETSRYKIGKELCEKVPIVLLLTATPHQGKSERFRYLLELIDPYKFFDNTSLNANNVKSVTVKNKKRAAKDLDGNLLFKNRIVSLIKISREKDNIETQLYEKVTNYISYYHKIAANSPILMFILITYQKMLSSSSRAIHDSLEKRYNLLKNNANAFNTLDDLDFDDIRDSEVQETYNNLIKYIGKEENLESIDIHTLKPQIAKELEILDQCLCLAKKATTGRHDKKIEKLLEIIDEVLSREGMDTKFIIFTEFIKTQEYIGEVLEDYGYKVSYFNGQMSLDEKIVNKSKFKEDHQFLISTDAGGEGINLQFANVMINYDLPWNPMKIEQRIGRIDRIGQRKMFWSLTS